MHLNVPKPSCAPQCTKGLAARMGCDPANQSAHAGGASYTYANQAFTLCPVTADKGEGLTIALKHFQSCCFFLIDKKLGVCF